MGWVLLFAMLIYLFWFFLRMFLDFIQEYLENKRKKLRYYQDVLIDYKERHEQNLALLARIIHYKFAAIPSCYAIGWDGLPKEKDCPGWGDTFTVYKSKNGKKFHRLYGCCGATERCHVSVYRDAFSKQNLCCKKCCKNYCPPSMEWYDNYLEYYALLLQYKKGSKEERSLISFLNKENIAQKLRKLSIFSQRDIRKDTLELIIYYTSSLNREAFRFRNAAEKKIDKHMQRFNLKCLK